MDATQMLAVDLAESGHPRPRLAATEAWLRNEARRQGLISDDEWYGTDIIPMQVVRDRIRGRRAAGSTSGLVRMVRDSSTLIGAH